MNCFYDLKFKLNLNSRDRFNEANITLTGLFVVLHLLGTLEGLKISGWNGNAPEGCCRQFFDPLDECPLVIEHPANGFVFI